MDTGLQHCPEGGDQTHHPKKEMQGKMVVWGGIKNS